MSLLWRGNDARRSSSSTSTSSSFSSSAEPMLLSLQSIDLFGVVLRVAHKIEYNMGHPVSPKSFPQNIGFSSHKMFLHTAGQKVLWLSQPQCGPQFPLIPKPHPCLPRLCLVACTKPKHGYHGYQQTWKCTDRVLSC